MTCVRVLAGEVCACAVCVHVCVYEYELLSLKQVEWPGWNECCNIIYILSLLSVLARKP